jgi:two-component sensor histidine kinase
MNLSETPYKDILGSTFYYIKQKAGSLYQGENFLTEVNAESFAGTTLWDSAGNAIGLIAFAGRTRFENRDFIEAVLNVVAIKTASEIERREIESNLRILVKEKELLMKEVQHRVKNNLNVISSLLSLELSRIDDKITRQTYISTINRIYSMSSLYEKLYLSENLKSVELDTYIKDLVKSIYQSYCIDPCNIILDLSLDEASMITKKAIPLGLIINELISNSLKYAYPNGKSGILHVRMQKGNSYIEVTVSDDGIGFSKEDTEKSKSIGIMLVKMLSTQIKAELEMKSDKGSYTRIRVPE